MPSGQTTLPDQSADIAILSTVLCCNPAREDQEKIIRELNRILLDGGNSVFL